MGWELAAAALALGAVGLGMLVLQARSGAKAEAERDQARKDQGARDDYEEALERWDAGGGLAGGMRDPE